MEKDFDGLEIYAVDLDGTLFEDEYPNLGAPKLAVIEKAKKVRADGAKLILWTCRAGVHLEKGIEGCRKHGLEFDAVNDNIPEMIEKFGGNSRKVSAIRYIDDRAITPEDWVKQTTTMNDTSAKPTEQRTYVKSVLVEKLCTNCGEKVDFTGRVYQTFPPQYPHICPICGNIDTYKKQYPTIEYENLGGE